MNQIDKRTIALVFGFGCLGLLPLGFVTSTALTALPRFARTIIQMMIEMLYVYGGKIVSIEPNPHFYLLLAVAAKEAGICILDEPLRPLGPSFQSESTVLRIVPPAFYMIRNAK